MADNKPYTSQLGAGLGLVNETKTLLDLWSPGMSVPFIQEKAPPPPLQPLPEGKGGGVVC